MTTLLYPKNTVTFRNLALFQISGKRVPTELIHAYLQIKAACARANWECSALSTNERNAILRAIARIEEDPEAWPALFPVDRFQAGAGTTLNMNINEAIARMARKDPTRPTLLHPNDTVNRSQSTNDTYPSALRIALLQQQASWLNALKTLQNAFSKKRLEFARTPKSGRTHLMDAVPMTLGDQFGSYSRTVAKLIRTFQRAYDDLREIPLGGTAVGNGVNTPNKFRPTVLKHLKALTGISKLKMPSNPFEIQASSLDFLNLAHALASTSIELGRIFSDLRLQASGPFTGIHEIELPELIPGSSIMPGKVNPSGLEMGHQVLIETLGTHAMSLWTAAQGQFELNAMLPALAPALLDSLKQCQHMVEMVASEVITPLRAVPESLQQHWKATDQWAALLAPEWGYETVATWVKLAHQAGKPFLVWLEDEKKIDLSSRSGMPQLHATTSLLKTSQTPAARAPASRRKH